MLRVNISPTIELNAHNCEPRDCHDMIGCNYEHEKKIAQMMRLAFATYIMGYIKKTQVFIM